MIIVVILFGLLVGSFLNVLIARVDELESIILTRSHCRSCQKDIRPFDLIPLFSFIVLRGKCRQCGKPIGWQYPIVEGTTAALAAAIYLHLGPTFESAITFLIYALLLVVVAIDWQRSTIALEFLLPAILLSFIAFLGMDKTLLAQAPWAVAIAGGGLAIIVYGSRERWMGAGDIALGVLMGLTALTIASTVVGLAVAFILGALVSLLLLLAKTKKVKDAIPFGPFLAIGIFVANFWGNELASWYLKLIGY